VSTKRIPFKRLQLRWLLLSAGVLTAAGIVLVQLLAWPLAEFYEGQSSNTERNSRSPNKETSVDSRIARRLIEADFLKVAEQRFQKPVFDIAQPDTKKPSTAPSVGQEPTLNVELVGTAVETDAAATRAWIKIDGSEERLIRVGDTLVGTLPVAKVKLIEAKRIVLAAEGFEMEYKFD
jgi:Type II secretion system protein C